MGEIGKIVSGAINTVEDVGKAVGDLGSGDIGGAFKDLGGAASNLMSAGVGAFMAMNPELGLASSLLGGAGGLGNILGGLVGQMGGFNPAQAGGMPSPFGSGGFNPGVMMNPFGSLGGLLGGQGSQGASGPKDFSSIQNELQQAQQSGDPKQLLNALKDANNYAESIQMASQMEKMRHDLADKIIGNISA